MLEQLKEAGFAKGLQYASEEGYAEMHKSVRSSLQLLQPGNRLSLAQLSIFPSKFDAAAAAAVIGISHEEAQVQLNQLQKLAFVLKDEAQTDSKSEQHYQLHLFMRDMAVIGYETQLPYLQAQSRFLQHFAALLQSTKHRHTPAGIASLHQLALQRHNLAKMFAILADQQPPVSADMSACCSLGHSALEALWLLRLDLPLVCAATESLLKWAEAGGFRASITDAEEQLGCMLLYESEQTERAEELLAAAMKARKQAGQNGVQMVMTLIGLATVTNEKINASAIDESEGYALGRRYCEEARIILTAAGDESDPETLWAALYGCSFIQNDSQKVEAIKKVLDCALKTLQPSHPAVLHIKSDLAAASDSDLAESIPLLTEHLSRCLGQVGHNGRLIPDAMLALGNALAHSKQPAEQQEGLQRIYEGLKLAEACYPADALIIARQEMLGRALIAANRVDEAIKVLGNSLPECERTCKQNSRITWIGCTILADA